MKTSSPKRRRFYHSQPTWMSQIGRALRIPLLFPSVFPSLVPDFLSFFLLGEHVIGYKKPDWKAAGIQLGSTLKALALQTGSSDDRCADPVFIRLTPPPRSPQHPPTCLNALMERVRASMCA